MLLILSNEDDISTNDVIDWLSYFNIPFIRINNTTQIDIEYFRINNEEVEFIINCNQPGINKNFRISNSEIDAFWYRRGNLKIKLTLLKPFFKFNKRIIKSFNRYLLHEKRSIESAILKILKDKPNSIGDYFDNDINKIYNLHLAKFCGLNVPETSITRKTEYLKSFNDKGLITKGIDNSHFDPLPNISVAGFTSEVSKKEIDELGEMKFNSLFQEKLEKRFELRVFYLEGKCYTMAIFSQNDEKTKVDFRNYNYDSPNRTVPYKLPNDLTDKIFHFMNLLCLKSGSLDFVFTKSEEYIFLEVNPIGQFKQVSKPCNFYLEKIIAKYFQKAKV